MSDLVRVRDLGDSLRPSPTVGKGQTRVPPYPLARGKHSETHTWLILVWAEDELYRPKQFLHRSPTPCKALGPGSSSPQTLPPPHPKDPIVYPPVEKKKHPYFSFFVLNSPVIWFPKYRRGRGNV